MKRLVFLFLYGVTTLLNYRLCHYQTSPGFQDVQTKIPVYFILSHDSVWYCGFAAVVADVYWLYLSHHIKELDAQNVYSYTDFITSLDPYFNVVYRFAAVYLMLQKRHDLSFKLLQKSLAFSYNSDDWRIYLYCAYTCYFYNHDIANTAYFVHKAVEQHTHFDQVLKHDRCSPPLFLSNWEKKLIHENTENAIAKQHINNSTKC